MTKEEKKSKLPIIIGIVTALFIGVVAFVAVHVINDGSNNDPVEPVVEKFSLDDEYYNSDKVNVDAKPEDIEKLIEEKKSFVIYSALPQCTEETARFREFIKDFQAEHKISFYNVSSSDIKKTQVYETVKYYPSVILYHDGELVKYLDFNSDADMPYYKSIEDFTKWFETYVNLEK